MIKLTVDFRKYFRAILLLSMLCILSQALLGQTNLQGRIVNKKGEALARINLMVYLPGNTALIAFAVSDEQGKFKTTVKAVSDSLVIKISSINYSNETRKILNVSQTLQFQLSEDVKQLEGISVIASPINKYGDTLSYLVGAFARSEDKALEDVLRRMPGIEVEASGQILYQGTAINKFYVEGLDLMEGRYSLVTKNLPKGSVSTVEILENHQPMRMLEDKVISQQAALNVKIKKGVTTTGTAQLGAGLCPFLWDVNVTPMTFTKKYQVVTSLQGNNTGDDVSQQLRVFTWDDFKNSSERPSEDVKMLNVLAASPPEIKTNRYLDNNIVLFNFNGLQKIGSQLSLRSNIYYTYDEQQSNTSMIRTIYMPDDTLQFSEKFDNQLTNNALYAKFNINRNVKKNYLNNDLKIQSGWGKQGGSVYTDGNKIVQALRNPLRSISNDMKSLNPIGKHIWEFRSYILFDHSPHSLAVIPGQFEDMLNDSVPYELVTQHIDIKRFYTDNSAGLVLGIKRFTISPRMGISYQQQSLLSNINLNVNDYETKMTSEFANDIDTRHLQGYLMTDIDYKLSKLTFSGSIALNSHKLNVTDIKPTNIQELTKLLADYRISADYKITGFWRVYSSWGYNERISDFDDMYSGFIMKNYRNLSQNMVPVSTTSTQMVTSRIEYRNQIISFFNTLSYLYSVSHSASTSTNWINADGSTIITNEYMPQTSNSHFLQAYTSKFFSAAKTTISLRVNYFQQKGTSVVNAESFNTRNNMIVLKPDLSIHITPWMNVDYNLDANTILTFIDQEQKSRISLLKHNIGFFFFPAKNQLFNFSTEYYRHNEVNNLFVDMMYRYTFTKKKVDIEVKCSNIFNADTYTSFLANAYSVWETTYLLRPFQVIFLVKFSF